MASPNTQSEGSVTRQVNGVPMALDCIILFLAICDLLYVFIYACWMSSLLLCSDWYPWTAAILRMTYDFLIIVTMCVLVSGPMTRAKTLTNVVLGSLGFLCVCTSVILVIVFIPLYSLWTAIWMITWRVCVSIFWCFVIGVSHDSENEMCRALQPVVAVREQSAEY